MIEYIKGTLEKKTPSHVVIDTGGVGRGIFITMRLFQSLPDTGSEVKLYTYDHVREDTRELYGFDREDEKVLFVSLVSVSGVGPRLAVRILNETTPETLISAIKNRDEKRLKAVKGLGAKTAAKMILDLDGKLDELSGVSDLPEDHFKIRNGTEEALRTLGYKETEIRSVVLTVFEKNPPETLPKTLEEAIRQTLQALTVKQR